MVFKKVYKQKSLIHIYIYIYIYMPHSHHRTLLLVGFILSEQLSPEVELWPLNAPTNNFLVWLLEKKISCSINSNLDN